MPEELTICCMGSCSFVCVCVNGDGDGDWGMGLALQEEMLDVFRMDPEFAKNEEMWSKIRKEIVGDDDDSDSDSSSSGSGSGSSEESR